MIGGRVCELSVSLVLCGAAGKSWNRTRVWSTDQRPLSGGGFSHLFPLQVKAASVLFVDNPVGTGFSFVDRADGFATDVSMVASDMLVLLQNFFTERPEFQVPQLPFTRLNHQKGAHGFWQQFFL